MYICILLHSYIGPYIHTYIYINCEVNAHTYKYMDIYTCRCINIYKICIYILEYMCHKLFFAFILMIILHVRMYYIHKYLCIYVCKYMHTYGCTYEYINIYTYIYRRMYIQICLIIYTYHNTSMHI
jgi:hypothetical protein